MWLNMINVSHILRRGLPGGQGFLCGHARRQGLTMAGRTWIASMPKLAHAASIRIAATGHLTGMGIGAGIFLIALGAILTFALNWTVAGLDMDVVGWILMAAGVLGLILFFVFWNRRRAPGAAQ